MFIYATSLYFNSSVGAFLQAHHEKKQIMISNRQGERVCCRLEGLCQSLNPSLFDSFLKHEKDCLSTYWWGVIDLSVSSHISSSTLPSSFKCDAISVLLLSRVRPCLITSLSLLMDRWCSCISLPLGRVLTPYKWDSFHFFVFVDSKSSNLVALSCFFLSF